VRALALCLSVALCVCAWSATASGQGVAPSNNRAIVASLTAKGVPADVAAFFAASKVTGTCPDDTTCVYVHTLPNGASRTITLKVFPTRAYTPTTAELASARPPKAPVYGFKYAANFQADPARVDLTYYVAKEGLPRVPARRAQAPYAPRIVLASAQAQAAPGGAGIAWTEVGKKAADAGIGGVLDIAKAKGINIGPLGTIYTLASSLSDVSTAMDLGKQNEKWLKELDALEKCAASPTNQVARSDPNYSSKTVEMVRRARSELKEVNSVRFLNIMTEKFADITPVTAVLAVGLKDGFVWSEQTLGDYSENTIMHEARKGVVECGPPADASGNLKYEAECTSGNEHTVTKLVGSVTWVWQAGIRYLPMGDYTYSSTRTIGGKCTETSSAAGSLAGSGYLFVFDGAAQKERGYGYEAVLNQIHARVTTQSGCRPGFTLPVDIDWLPMMRGFPGTGGQMSGVAQGNGCLAGQPAKLTWDFNLPPKK